MTDNNNVPNWDGRNKNRTPMQWSDETGAGFTKKNPPDTWLPINPNYVQINLEAQKIQAKSTYKYFQTLTSLRKKKAFREGSYKPDVMSEYVFAHVR